MMNVGLPGLMVVLPMVGLDPAGFLMAQGFGWANTSFMMMIAGGW